MIAAGLLARNAVRAGLQCQPWVKTSLAPGSRVVTHTIPRASSSRTMTRPNPRSAAEMDDIFEPIALELRHQYSIGYRPESFVNDGKWHRVKVKVTSPRGLPKLFVRYREGYYATPGAR